MRQSTFHGASARMKVLLPDITTLRLALGVPALQRKGVEIVVATDALEAARLLHEHRPRLAILSVEGDDKSRTGAEICREARTREDLRQTAIFLGAERALTARQRREVQASGCDELIELPLRPRQLLDRAALYLGLVERQPRLPVETLVDVEGIESPCTSVNLSTSGVLVRARQGLTIGQTMRLQFQLADQQLLISGQARLVRVVPGETPEELLLAFKFLDLEPSAQRALANLSTFQYEEGGGWRRVTVRGAITEASPLDALAPLLAGRVEMDLSGLTYINSWGTRAWSRLLTQAQTRLQELKLVRCAVSFVLAAGMTEEFVGPGRITSFYAPYTCPRCELDELVLLEVTPALEAARDAPPRDCPRCRVPMDFDDIPTAYFAFLGT